MSLLELDNVMRVYWARRSLLARPSAVLAVAGLSLNVERGCTLGLVGESGCGKSTTGRLALGLEAADGGNVRFDGAPLPKADSADWRRLRARMQLVFQDPLGALDRRMPIGNQIAEPLAVHAMGSAGDRRRRAAELLRAVGLGLDHADRYPH